MGYVQEVISELVRKNPGEKEFHQAANFIVGANVAGFATVSYTHLRAHEAEQELGFRTAIPNIKNRRCWSASPSPTGRFCSACPGWTTRARFM